MYKVVNKELMGSSSGRNSVVECQLPKLDVGGSNPLARFFSHLAGCCQRVLITVITLIVKDDGKRVSLIPPPKVPNDH